MNSLRDALLEEVGSRADAIVDLLERKPRRVDLGIVIPVYSFHVTFRTDKMFVNGPLAVPRSRMLLVY